jgi:hypothetical protein
MSMTMGRPGQRDSLTFRLAGMKDDIGTWVRRERWKMRKTEREREKEREIRARERLRIERERRA